MVRHEPPDRPPFWTLPRGAIEDGERAEDAAVRELREEAGLAGRPVRILWQDRYSLGLETCVLVVVDDDGMAHLGVDPELGEDQQVLTAVSWLRLSELEVDPQVGRVLDALASIEDQHRER